MLRPFAVACLVAVASLGWTGWAAAAACSSTDYYLSTQAEVDALGATGCDSISGFIAFVENVSSDGETIWDLSSLANLTSVGGDLFISGIYQGNLDGFKNLTTVGGNLTVQKSAFMREIEIGNLANLTYVGGNLTIAQNIYLQEFEGLRNLTSVGGYLNISYNNDLRNLGGLSNLTNVGGSVIINANNRLANIDGLTNLTSIGGDLDIYLHGNLDNLDGLANLTSIGGYLDLSFNFALRDLNGLANLTSVGDYLSISDNNGLFCCEGVAPLLGWPDGPPADTVVGDIDIGDNRRSCDYIDQILASVSGPTKPTITSASATSGGISVEFNTSTTTDALFPITGYEAVCIGSSADLNVTATGSSSPITVNGVTRGRDYSCTVAPVTGLGTLPVSDAVIAKSDFPATPTVTSTDYEDGTIRLTVSVADNGGADITEYSASCTDGTSTFTGTSATPTIEVTGLTNGTAYTCSASATNAVGSSGASASTDSITPEALPTGLPIWLLYEATK